MSTTTITAAPPAAAAGRLADPGRYRAEAYRRGASAALSLLHAEVGDGVLPTGPGGHALVPPEVEAACDRYAAPGGPRSRGTRAGEARLGRVPAGTAELVALRLPADGRRPAGDAPPDPWLTGVAWVRLGLAEKLAAQAADHLRGRTVQGTATLNLPLVRAVLADVACGLAEAEALLGGEPSPADLRRVHRSLDEAGRTCLHLFGAVGFLAVGPGGDARVCELLGDAYAPGDPDALPLPEPTDAERP